MVKRITKFCGIIAFIGLIGTISLGWWYRVYGVTKEFEDIIWWIFAISISVAFLFGFGYAFALSWCNEKENSS